MLMAMMVLLSSTGFAMDIHYCQNQLKSINLAGKAKTCHEKVVKPNCHKKENSSEQSSIDKKNCCHNESIVVEKTDLKLTNLQIFSTDNISVDFIVAFTITFLFQNDVSFDVQKLQLYQPPLPNRDHVVLYQSFLI